MNLLRPGRCVFQITTRLFSVTSCQNSKKVAVVLSGSGVYDGTEITEAASVMIHLSRHNADVSFFAPNIEQMHVVNHLTGEPQVETRNVLVESARISRGNIRPLDQLKSGDFQALIIPGGFGAAKNLSDYAINGADCKINDQVEKKINEFALGFKPIGMCCISPVIAAKILPHCQITVGKSQKGKEWPFAGTGEDLKLMGATVVEKDVNEVHVDPNFKLVTTPAFMKNASFYEVFCGIGKMVDEVLSLVK